MQFNVTAADIEAVRERLETYRKTWVFNQAAQEPGRVSVEACINDLVWLLSRSA